MKLAAVGAALVLLSGCVHVTVRDDDEAASIDCSKAPSGTTQVSATPVASHPLDGGKTLTSVRLDVPPGARSNAHKHAGLVYGYVLEGAVCSQITGDAALKPYRAGDHFFEPPGVEHLAFTNPTSVPAKVLVTFVADTGATLTTPVR